MKRSVKDKFAQFENRSVQRVAAASTQAAGTDFETPEQRQARIDHLLNDYAAFEQYYFGHLDNYKPCADFHVEAANNISEQFGQIFVLEWPRGHAKTTHTGVIIPMWLKAKGQLKYMIRIDPEEGAAKERLKELRDELENNQRYIADFGEQHNPMDWGDTEFSTLDGCFFKCFTLGINPRGTKKRSRRPDYIVVDDIDNEKVVFNPDIVQQKYDYLKGAVYGTMHMGRGRFVFVNNRIHPFGVLAKFAEEPDIWYSKVNTIDENGNASWPAQFTPEEIARVKKKVKDRWEPEYQNNPFIRGLAFDSKYFDSDRFIKPFPLEKYIGLVCHLDPAYKKAKGDFKAMSLWGKTAGGNYHKLWTYLRQGKWSQMMLWFFVRYNELPEAIKRKMICSYEGSFQQADNVGIALNKAAAALGFVNPFMPHFLRGGDKMSRIKHMAFNFEYGRVFFNIEEIDTEDTKASLKQYLSFNPDKPNIPNDGPDTDQRAWTLLDRFASSGQDARVTPRVSELSPNNY